MSQTDFIRELSIKLGLTQAETKKLFKNSIGIIVEFLDNDISLSIPRLGTFSTTISKKRKSFSPFHNQNVILPPKRSIRFSSSTVIQNQIKTKDL